jgi:NTP pyrophosphatase (non-canonical NTP hydrolase)
MTNRFYGDEEITAVIRILQGAIHGVAVDHGWWDESRNNGECIALMHSELSEALEALRHHRPVSDHIAPIGLLEEELADVIIRVLDFSEALNLDIGSALLKKIEFNRTRPHKHGGKAF